MRRRWPTILTAVALGALAVVIVTVAIARVIQWNQIGAYELISTGDRRGHVALLVVSAVVAAAALVAGIVAFSGAKSRRLKGAAITVIAVGFVVAALVSLLATTSTLNLSGRKTLRTS